jgi:hypothetical protein
MSLWRKRHRTPTTEARDGGFIEVSRPTVPGVGAARGTTATIRLAREIEVEVSIAADPA